MKKFSYSGLRYIVRNAPLEKQGQFGAVIPLAWRAAMLLGSLYGGRQALRAGAEGLQNFSKGEGMQGLKNLGYGGLNAVMAISGLGPETSLLKSMPLFRNAAIAGKAIRPVEKELGPIASWWQKMRGATPEAIAAMKRVPPATAVGGRIANWAIRNPTMGGFLRGMNPEVAAGMGRFGQGLARVENKLSPFQIPAGVGVFRTW